MFFVKDQRQDIVNANPGLSFAEVGRELGKAWKELTPKKRERYNNLSAKDKIRAQHQKEQASSGVQVV